MRTLLFSLLATPFAAAQDAPSGRAYGSECCSMIDCFEEQDKNVETSSNGFHIKNTGEAIPYADKRVQMSKDAKYHRCAKGLVIPPCRSQFAFMYRTVARNDYYNPVSPDVVAAAMGHVVGLLLTIICSPWW